MLRALVPWLGLVAAFAGLSAPARASTPRPPPDWRSSCARAEYEAEKHRGPAQPGGSGSAETPSLVVVAGDSTVHLNTTKQITMGQQVTVCIMGLYDWIYRQKKDPSDLRLFIGGNMLAAIPPSAVSPSGQEYLNFTLRMGAADTDDWNAWAAIVYASRHSPHQLPISIAFARNRQVFESNEVVTIEQYPRRWPYLVVGMALVLAAFVYLAVKTDILRDSAGPQPPKSRRPLSLGLVQMAFWFFLVVAAYAYICVSTRQIHIPLGSMLGLLGISATTGLAAIAVDKQKAAAAIEKREKLVASRCALEVLIDDPALVPAKRARYRCRLEQVEARIARLSPAPRKRDPIRDLLSDGDGVSFHRFQIAVWTIVLGVVFVWAVYRDMSMPEFDASLLTLMGISSGTYVGFKFPEKPKA
jgi:hypothetical protein